MVRVLDGENDDEILLYRNKKGILNKSMPVIFTELFITN